LQAEDGIRDFHVTGVQTCALPISGAEHGGVVTDPVHLAKPQPTLTKESGRGHRDSSGQVARLPLADEMPNFGMAISSRDCGARRSEERRVGKVDTDAS